MKHVSLISSNWWWFWISFNKEECRSYINIVKLTFSNLGSAFNEGNSSWDHEGQSWENHTLGWVGPWQSSSATFANWQVCQNLFGKTQSGHEKVHATQPRPSNPDCGRLERVAELYRDSPLLWPSHSRDHERSEKNFQPGFVISLWIWNIEWFSFESNYKK